MHRLLIFMGFMDCAATRLRSFFGRQRFSFGPQRLALIVPSLPLPGRAGNST